MFISQNPVTSEVLGRYESLNDKDLSSLLRDAHTAHNELKAVLVTERCLMLKRFRILLNNNKELLAQTITAEMGKPITQARAEIDKSVLLCDFYAENVEKLLEPKTFLAKPFSVKLRHEALGIILGIMPWNFPVWQSLRFAIPAIMAGNAVLLKPAPNTALSVLMLEGFFSESFTIQVFKTVLSDTTLVPKIIADPRVQGVSLTGSDKAGSKVGALAGKYLKKSVLELGGCDPFIVFPDADVMLAAKLAVHSRINNTGQTCIAAKRLLVHKDIYKEFKDYLIHLFEELKMGDPIQESTQVSSLARADIRDILHVQYLDALAKGAKAIVEGGLVQGNGFYYNPALLENTNKKMLVRRQEVFGPLLTIQGFKDARDAIDQANDNRYGLGASIWTQNASLQQQMESKLQVGYIVFNNFVSSDPRIPFGGIKQSGYGRELGDAGIHEFTNLKSILYS